jgi:mono/diheme cytochrome c family protein
MAGTLLVAGCSNAAGTTASFSLPALPGSPTAPEGQPLPELDVTKIAAGEELYAQFCASCHGADLHGDPDWQVIKEDGSFPPPPQDSFGHNWHHGDDFLVEIILDGSRFPQSRMPAFAGQLTEAGPYRCRLLGYSGEALDPGRPPPDSRPQAPGWVIPSTGGRRRA